MICVLMVACALFFVRWSSVFVVCCMLNVAVDGGFVCLCVCLFVRVVLLLFVCCLSLAVACCLLCVCASVCCLLFVVCCLLFAV